jgi:hypothetical protein
LKKNIASNRIATRKKTFGYKLGMNWNYPFWINYDDWVGQICIQFKSFLKKLEQASKFKNWKTGQFPAFFKMKIEEESKNSKVRTAAITTKT